MWHTYILADKTLMKYINIASVRYVLESLNSLKGRFHSKRLNPRKNKPWKVDPLWEEKALTEWKGTPCLKDQEAGKPHAGAHCRLGIPMCT